MEQNKKSFRPSQRVRKAAEFKNCFDQGERFHGSQMLLLVAKNEEPQNRLGLMVSKKTGNAVVRNAWKRLLREVFRCENSSLGHQKDHLFLIKKGTQGKPSESAKKEIYYLLRKSMKK